MGKIVIATGGTSDQHVAEEAARTAEFLGNDVARLYDVGVSGIHRLLSNSEVLMDASVVIEPWLYSGWRDFSRRQSLEMRHPQVSGCLHLLCCNR